MLEQYFLSGVNYLVGSATIILAGLLSLFFRGRVSYAEGWLLAPLAGSSTGRSP